LAHTPRAYARDVYFSAICLKTWSGGFFIGFKIQICLGSSLLRTGRLTLRIRLHRTIPRLGGAASSLEAFRFCGQCVPFKAR
jgi:hypothetical protein